MHRPRLLSDNGSSYLASDLAAWLEDNTWSTYAAPRIIKWDQHPRFVDLSNWSSAGLITLALAFPALQSNCEIPLLRLNEDAFQLIAIDNAIDVLLMGIGSLELRVNKIERNNRTKLAPNEMPQVNPAFDGFPKLLKN
jgi:hypothetical protein